MVDLPEPLGPTTPTRSPAAMCEGQALVRRAAAAGVGEAYRVEGYAGR